MLADHVTVNVLRVQAGAWGDGRPQPCGIEYGSRAENASGKHWPSQLHDQRGHHVHRGRRDDDYRVRGGLCDRRNYLAVDGRVVLQHLLTILPGLLCDARRQNNDATPGQVGKRTPRHTRCVSDRGSVGGISGLRRGLGVILVYQQDIGT